MYINLENTAPVLGSIEVAHPPAMRVERTLEWLQWGWSINVRSQKNALCEGMKINPCLLDQYCSISVILPTAKCGGICLYSQHSAGKARASQVWGQQVLYGVTIKEAAKWSPAKFFT